MGEDEMKPKIEHEYHVSSYNLQQVEKVARSGLIKGSLGGLLFGTVTSALLSRYVEAYRDLRIPLKAAFIAEHAVYQINRKPEPTRSEDSLMYSSEEVVRTSQEKLVSFIKENRTSLFAGAVVTAIGITAARDRSSTSLSQKFMNVRLIGQMVGIAAIVALATLSSSER